jgi:hypothetical protein
LPESFWGDSPSAPPMLGDLSCYIHEAFFKLMETRKACQQKNYLGMVYFAQEQDRA